jgi:hypothetical protein
VTLGVTGGLLLFFCGIAIFAPDPETPEKTAAAGATPTVTRQTTGAASATPTTTAVRSSAAAPSKSPTIKPVSYADCTEVEEAGKAPIRKGQPGFQKKFDLDGDGKGCESNGDDDPLSQEDEESGSEDSGTDPRFSTCAKANAAGYGPYYKGSDPEYHWYRDRDGDGVVCE